MAKLTLDTIAKYDEISKINSNFDKIEAEFQDKVLYRNNPVGEPNTLSVDIDVNNKTIFNASSVSTKSLTIGGQVVVPSALSVTGIDEIPNYAALRAYIGSEVTFLVKGHTAALDGGGGIFRYDPADTASADNGGTILVDALGRRWKREFSGAVNVRWFGDDTAAMTAALNATGGSAIMPPGTFSLLDGKVGELQIQSRQLSGFGSGSTIHVNNIDNTGFRLGAIGGGPSFGGSRVVSKFENLGFTCQTKTDNTPVRAIDVQSVNPIVLQDLRLFGFGPEAVKITSCYYGSMEGVFLVKSGLRLNDANNLEFRSGDVKGSDTSLPANSIMFGATYPVHLTESDGIKFTDTTFESWDVPVIRLERAKNTRFNGSWFEACTGDHVIKMEQAQTLTFNDCFLDLFPHYTGSFIRVDNSIPNATASQRWSPLIKIVGGFLRLTTDETAKPLVSVVNAEIPRLLIEGVSFTRGYIYADPSVKIDVKSISLEDTDRKSFYSCPNAKLDRNHNSWMPASLSSDWDFTAGANMAQVGSVGLTVATTTADGEFLTGTRGVKVTGFASDGVTRTFERNCGTNGDMGVVTVDGHTYLFFVRLKATQAVSIRIRASNGSLDYDGTIAHVLPAGEWRDYVIKTSEANTWGQGRTLNPRIRIAVTNTSGAAADVFVDRLDYQICLGDHQI